MCGICGIVLPGVDSSQAGERTVRRMCSCLVHRGPDEEGVYASGSIALGHRRLSIIDLSGGRQPLCNEDGSVWVIFNGEIYNYRSIRDDLREKGHRFRTRSDTEVIVHLYEEYGDEMFGKLNGMFAIGLWDAANRKLLLARDRLGKKPLYYSMQDGKFLFASELKAILAVPEVPREVAPESVSDYLSFLYVPPPATIFRGIHKLEPATYLVFHGGEITRKRYWKPVFGSGSGLSWTSALERFQDLLQDAVRLRMESEVPLGAFLSGGIDSSSVVAVMAKLSDRPVKTTSIGFREVSFNELPYAGEVARRYATDHHEFILEADFIRDLASILYHLDEPFGDSSALPTYLLCKKMRQNVTVALSGDGGDENFAGYDRYVSALAEERIRNRVPALFLNLLFSGIKGIISPYVRSYARIENLTLDLPLAACNTFFCFDDELKGNLFTGMFRGTLGDHSSVDVMERYFRDVDGLASLSRLQYVDLVSYLPEDILMKVDRMSMAHSLEVRAPLLDYRMVEFAAGLPPQWKIRNGSGKRFLKDAVAAMIPEDILNRSKMGFGVPIGAWFRGRLHSLVEAVLFDRKTIARGYFEPAFLRNLWARHIKGPAWQIDVSHLLWVLLVLELWHRLYVDRDSVEDLEGWIRRAVLT
jgi:asparagine synthase (glutamine-hydrolysing)